MRMPIRCSRLIAALALAFIALGGACGGNNTPNIAIKEFQFKPRVARVSAGDTVTWTNNDPQNHAIRDVGGAFTGPDFGPPAGTRTFRHTYDKPGSYPYICNIHNSMSGTINVI